MEDIGPFGVDHYAEYVTEHDPVEVAFKDYEYERWEEDPERWSPLINLEQLAERPDPEEEWWCPDWIPVGSKTILSAEPKTGKTILLFHILKAVTEGGTFLGKKCPPARVLYLSELTETELKRQIKEVPGLLGNKNFYVLLPEEAPQTMKTWDDTVEFANRMLETTQSKILIIDTFGSLAKLPPGGENDSATVQNTINKLNSLFKNRYLSVILTHHNRKKSEERKARGDQGMDINAARGSSAFVGGAGQLIFMEAREGCRREFGFYGRYRHDVHKSLVLENGEYKEVNYGYPQASPFRAV